MGDPDQAAHLLGKLIAALGPGNVLWGTDSIWYGSPQDQIDAFRTFEITAEAQERFGYAPLTTEVKAGHPRRQRRPPLRRRPRRRAVLDHAPPTAPPAAPTRPYPDRLLGPKTAEAARQVFAARPPLVLDPNVCARIRPLSRTYSAQTSGSTTRPGGARGR